jgi:hypothetical protein
MFHTILLCIADEYLTATGRFLEGDQTKKVVILSQNVQQQFSRLTQCHKLDGTLQIYSVQIDELEQVQDSAQSNVGVGKVN